MPADSTDQGDGRAAALARRPGVVLVAERALPRRLPGPAARARRRGSTRAPRPCRPRPRTCGSGSASSARWVTTSSSTVAGSTSRRQHPRGQLRQHRLPRRQRCLRLLPRLPRAVGGQRRMAEGRRQLPAAQLQQRPHPPGPRDAVHARRRRRDGPDDPGRDGHPGFQQPRELRDGSRQHDQAPRRPGEARSQPRIGAAMEPGQRAESGVLRQPRSRTRVRRGALRDSHGARPDATDQHRRRLVRPADARQLHRVLPLRRVLLRGVLGEHLRRTEREAPGTG